MCTYHLTHRTDAVDNTSQNCCFLVKTSNVMNHVHYVCEVEVTPRRELAVDIEPFKQDIL